MPDVEQQLLNSYIPYFYSSILYITIFVGSAYVSLQGPIYPQEAILKGLTTAQYSFVYGSFELISTFSSPLFGAYIEKIGPTLMFKLGSVVTTVFIIAFGFVNLLPSGRVFFAISVLLRCLGAIGESAAVIAANVLLLGLFTNAQATALSLMRMAYFLGLTVGPSIGTLLYNVKGFMFPYIVIGGVLAFLLPFIFIFIRDKKLIKVESTKGEKSSYWQALKNPRIIIELICMASVILVFSCIQALLETHLRPFHLPETILGAIFTVFGGVYAFSSIIFGKTADMMVYHQPMTTIGLITAIIGLLFLGPAPFIHIDLTITIVYISLAIQAVGIGCVMTNSSIDLINIIAGDNKQNISVNGTATGMYITVVSISIFIGSTAGGVLFDAIGFPMTTMVLLGMELLALVLITGEQLMDLFKRSKTLETTYL
ncbi:hypothetical protein CHUAL_002280 [Chamberlinius hualienensis]